MQNLKNEMPPLMARIETLMGETDGDIWTTCNRLADEFELWDERQAFPRWLQTLVEAVEARD